MRGSKTHGWGAKKKHRGAGHRGGRGRAGSGKRGDAKKPSYWVDPKWMGKYGFKKKNIKEIVKPINFQDIEEKLGSWHQNNIIKKEQDSYVIDLNKIGYNKLLSKGSITQKLNITVKYASEKAIKKIKETGGGLTLTATQK